MSDTGKTPEKTETKPSNTKAKPGTKKRKRTKTKNERPRPFLNGYVRFINENREIIRLQNPTLNPVEITKLVADSWSKLPDEDKKPYLAAAEIDKERYNKELAVINLQKLNNPPEPDVQNDKTCSKSKTETLPKNFTVPTIVKIEKCNGERKNSNEIAIFTEDFLDHNKTAEQELRILRKSTIDYEQQNSVLEKHIENMSNGVDKLQNEIVNTKLSTQSMEAYLVKLRGTLSAALNDGGKIENVDKYLGDLHSIIKTQNLTPASLIKLNKCREKLAKNWT